MLLRGKQPFPLSFCKKECIRFILRDLKEVRGREKRRASIAAK